MSHGHPVAELHELIDLEIKAKSDAVAFLISLHVILSISRKRGLPLADLRLATSKTASCEDVLLAAVRLLKPLAIEGLKPKGRNAAKGLDGQIARAFRGVAIRDFIDAGTKAGRFQGKHAKRAGIKACAGILEGKYGPGDWVQTVERDLGMRV